MMAEVHPLFATPGQQIALRLPSSAFFPSCRGGSSAPCTGKTDVANESALRSARSCRASSRRADRWPSRRISTRANRRQNCLPKVAHPAIAARAVSAKDRFHLTLYLFLQKHYSSGSSSAWALTSYLESIDSGKRVAAKRPAASTARSSLRPPAPVPAR